MATGELHPRADLRRCSFGARPSTLSRIASARSESASHRRPQTSNNIIQKGLAFVRERSGSVTVPGTSARLGILPRRLHGQGGAVVVAATTPRNPTEDPDVKTHRYATRHSVRGFAAR